MLPEPVQINTTPFDIKFGTLCACLNGSSSVQILTSEAQSFLDDVLKLVTCEGEYLRVRPYAQQLGRADKLPGLSERLGISSIGDATDESFPAKFL